MLPCLDVGRNIDHIAEVPCPVFAIHSKNDEMVHWSHAEMLVEHCSSPYPPWILETERHAVFPRDAAKFFLLMDRFLEHCKQRLDAREAVKPISTSLTAGDTERRDTPRSSLKPAGHLASIAGFKGAPDPWSRRVVGGDGGGGVKPEGVEVDTRPWEAEAESQQRRFEEERAEKRARFMQQQAEAKERQERRRAELRAQATDPEEAESKAEEMAERGPLLAAPVAAPSEGCSMATEEGAPDGSDEPLLAREDGVQQVTPETSGSMLRQPSVPASTMPRERSSDSPAVQSGEGRTPATAFKMLAVL